MPNPIVTSLPDYVEQNRLPLIGKSLLRGKTIDLVQLETGVKQETALNLISAAVKFGNGGACGWDASDNTVTLSQRKLTPAFLKVNVSFCQKQLLNKWASYMVKMAAGRETLPFEEKFMEEISKEINEKVEKMIWQGDSASLTARECDGYIKLLDAVGAGTIVSTDAAGTSAYNRIKGVYNAMPARVIDKDDAVIFVSEADYREFIQNLVAANLYHFNPDYKNGEYMLPGTSIRVIAVNGLDGSDSGKMDRMVAGRLSNFFYGVDAEDDKDTMDLWFSKDNQEFRLACDFAIAAQVAYPNEIVMGKQA